MLRPMRRVLPFLVPLILAGCGRTILVDPEVLGDGGVSDGARPDDAEVPVDLGGCTTDDDCGFGLTCIDDRCVEGLVCFSDLDCAAGERCEAGE